MFVITSQPATDQPSNLQCSNNWAELH